MGSAFNPPHVFMIWCLVKERTNWTFSGVLAEHSAFCKCCGCVACWTTVAQTLGHSIHIKHRDPRTLSIKGPAHNRRRTVVCAEQSHSSGPPNDFRQRRNLPLKQPILHSSHHTSSWRLQVTGVCEDTCQTICLTDFYCNCCTCNSSF
jgi:hypothetical protein